MAAISLNFGAHSKSGAWMAPIRHIFGDFLG